MNLHQKMKFISDGIGALLLLADNNSGYCDTFCFTTGDVIGFFTIGLVAPITGSAGTGIHAGGNKYGRAAFSQFNSSRTPIMDEQENDYLRIGVAENGFGFTLRF